MAQACSISPEDLLGYSVGKTASSKVSGGILDDWIVVSESTINSDVAKGIQDGMNAAIAKTSSAGLPDFRFIDLTTGDAYVIALNCDHDGEVYSVVVIYVIANTNYHLAFLKKPER